MLDGALPCIINATVLLEQNGGPFEAGVSGHSDEVPVAETAGCERGPFHSTEHGADDDAVRETGSDLGVAADQSASDLATRITNLSQQLRNALLRRFLRGNQSDREEEPGSSPTNRRRRGSYR